MNRSRSSKRKRATRRSGRSKSVSRPAWLSFNIDDRLDVLRYAFIVLGGVIIARLFFVQILHNGYYEALAFDSHRIFQELIPDRGDILVQDRYSDTGTYAIATNTILSEVFAEPKHVDDPQVAAQALSPLLNIPVEDLVAKLDKPDDPYEVLKRRVPEEVVDAIKELDITGVHFRQEHWRYYPEGQNTAHITGYFGYQDDDRVGQYGIEGSYDEELRGMPGNFAGEKDALGRFISIGDSDIANAVDGADLELTIDKNIQFFACDKLTNAVEKYGAKGGTVIIMQPKTGAILALCNAPTYDPNKYNEVESVEVFNNLAVDMEYEPGSVFKAFTMAAGIDLGVVSAQSTYDDTGSVKIGNFTIRNSDGKANGIQTMTQVLEKSLNTGTIHVARAVGDAGFYQYVTKFGFGEPTGIEMSNEQDGNLDSLAKLRDIYTATGSYGQGLTVTPMQLIAGYGALANGGKLMKPYLVHKELLSNGDVIEHEPQFVRNVITPQTANIVTAMLVNVVDKGHATGSHINNYSIAGKTGTAQVAGPGGYVAGKHNATFVGYGPASDPQFVMLTFLNEPSNTEWAAGSAAPLFGEIAQYLVQYLRIAPDRVE